MNLPFNLYAFLRDTSLIVFAWFLIMISFFIWGRFLSRILNIKISGNKGTIANIWLGFTFCIFFFSIYHLFFPINAFASSLFYFPAIFVFFVNYSKKIPKFIKSIGWLKLTVILLTIFAAATVSIQLPLNYDTGYYHLNSIRWSNEHHIVKGIGNLHNRLGFNQIFFLYAASLNFHPYLNDYAYHAANGFLYALYATGVILSGTFIDLLLLCLFFFIPMPYYWINNPNSDIASTFIQIVAFRYLIEAFYFNINSKERSHYITIAALLSALMVFIKLSNAFLALGFGISTLLFNKRYSFETAEKKLIGRSFIFIGVFFIVWLTRGYIQTGYPAFPSSIGKINFEWTLPERIAQNARDCIYAGTRLYGQSFDMNDPRLKNGEWFTFWCRKNFYDEQYFSDNEDFITYVQLILFPMTVFMWGMGSLCMLIISILLVIISIVLFVKNKELFPKSFNLINLLITEVISIIFWFIAAPELRYTNGMFILLFITSILVFKTALPKIKVIKKIKIAMMFYSVVIFIWCFSISYSMNEFGLCGMVVLKKLPMNTFLTDSGLKILVPANGKQPWDSDLPATPEPEKGLTLIGTSIDSGFRIKE